MSVQFRMDSNFANIKPRRVIFSILNVGRELGSFEKAELLNFFILNSKHQL